MAATVVVAVLVVSSLALSPVPSVGSNGPPSPSATMAALRVWDCGAVIGAVPPDANGCQGYVPIVGANVYVVPVGNCTEPLSVDSLASCGSPAPVTVTDASGGANASVQLGLTVWVISQSTATWEGDSVVESFSQAVATSVELVAYPLEAAGNMTVVLPGYSTLEPYAFNGNCVDCNGYYGRLDGYAGYGSQIPIASWTQDGVYYVNDHDQLVFYSIANRTVQVLDGHWVPLYMDWMQYPGVENTEWVTADGSYVYTLGCASDCRQPIAQLCSIVNGAGLTPEYSYPDLEVEAVNVTTGHVFWWNISNVVSLGRQANGDACVVNHPYSLTDLNGQAVLVGLGGNDSIATLLEANGTVLADNLWTGVNGTTGVYMPFFEANNIAWVPPLDSFINVEADGDKADRVQQELLTPGNPANLVSVATTTYYDGHSISNGANYAYYNVTSHQLAVTSGLTYTSGTDFTTAVYQMVWNSLWNTYTIGPLIRQFNATAGGQHGITPLPGASDGRRATTFSDGLITSLISTAQFWNNTYLWNAGTGLYVGTNLSSWMDPLALSTYGDTQVGGTYSLGGAELFYNGSYGVLPSSVECRSKNGCALLGNQSQVPGTMYWTWPMGSSDVPYPSTTALAQTTGPSAPQDFAATVEAPRTVHVTWQPPASDANPLLNYTLFVVSSLGARFAVAVLPTARSADLAVDEGVSYSLTLVASNLHGTGSSVQTNLTVAVPSPLDTLRWVEVSNSSIGVAWNPVTAEGSLSGATVSWGPAGGAFDHSIALGAISSYTIRGLRPLTAYGITVQGINGLGEGNASPVLIAETTGTAVAEFRAEFDEVGLATGTTWQVSMNAQSAQALAGDPIAFFVPNGSYPFTVSPTGGVYPDPGSGVLIVSGSAATKLVTFARPSYDVTFTEAGLPNGTWSLALNGTIFSAAVGSPIVGSMPNGTFRYSLADYPGYHQGTLPYAGTGIVNGASVVEPTLLFALVTYSVTFAEVGLPNGAAWNVTFDGTTRSVQAPSTIVFGGLTNGTAAFVVGAVPGYTASPSSGSVVVNGSSLLERSTFTPAGPVLYAIAVIENGLPSGLLWSATMGNVTIVSSMSTVTFNLPNGTYSYNVSGPAPWSPIWNGNGSVRVQGTIVSFVTTFVYTFQVTIFQRTNYAPWMTEVTLTSAGAGVPAGLAGTSWFANATLPSTTFYLANGTYSYTITSTDHPPLEGGFRVNGTALGVDTTLPSLAYDPSWWGWAVLGMVAVVLGAAVVIGGTRRRGGSGTQGPPT